MSLLLVDANKSPVPGADKFDADLPKREVGKVTNMFGMFNQASSFNSDISKWDVSRVTSMSGMFYTASAFNIDISNWDVSRVTTMVDMFNQASSFKQTLCGKWKISTAYQSRMFIGSGGEIGTCTSKLS